MKHIFPIILLFLVGSCSTTTTHVGSVEKTENGHEYSIKETKTGFIVAGHYNEYQFVRNSKNGFIGCMRVINNAAREHAESMNKLRTPTTYWGDIFH